VGKLEREFRKTIRTRVPVYPYIKHLVLLDVETPQEWEEFAKNAVEALKPANHHEIYWAYRIAVYQWILLRYQRMETALMSEDSGIADAETVAWAKIARRIGGMDRIEQWIDIAESRLRRAHEMYRLRDFFIGDGE